MKSFVLAFGLLLVTATAQAQSYLGYTTIGAGEDNGGNANYLVGSEFTAAAAGSITSGSLYITPGTSSGHNWAIALYDSKGAGGGPGNLLAYTTSKAEVDGWNTANVVSPVTVSAGTSYWIIWQTTGGGTQHDPGSQIYKALSYGAFPTTFPSGWNTYSSVYSAYFTVATTAAVNGQCGSANGSVTNTPPTTNLCSVGTASAVAGSGPWLWTCAGTNGGTTANCSTGISPLLDEEFNPPNGTSSQTGTAGLTTSDSLFKIDGPWVGTGSNEINPPNAVFTTADPTTQKQPATGFLSLSTYASGGKEYAGEIISNNLPGYGCGYYEARMIVDPQRTAGGVVSFFWMQAGGTLNARTYGPHEFDIEFLLNESWLTSTNTGAVHYTTHPSNATYTQTLSFNPALGYHRYGFLWVPGTLSYTVDGVIVHTVTGSDVASCMGGWIMANVWTGNPSWGGGPPASPFSGVYDWFKFWPGVTAVQAN